MVQPLMRSPLLSSDEHCGEHGGLASIYLSDAGSPLATRDGIRLAFYGSVHLDDAPADGRPLAEQLLERYLQGGRAALCGLNGTYVAAIWEEEQRRMTLIKDRVGYSKLFYWHSGSRLMFASEYKAISWHPSFPKVVDAVGLADIFLYRSPLEGRTLFRDIHSMPPAGILTFQDGRLRVETYWRIQFCSPGAREKPDEEYADELAERLRAAVKRRMHPDSCILITGGLDSRIVAGMYRQVDPDSDLIATTLGLPEGQDVRVGRDLANALKISHHHIPVGDDYLARWAAHGTWQSEGKNGSYASWICAQAPFMAEYGLRYAVSGLYGNFISARHFPKASLTARTLEEAVAAVEGNLHPYLGQLKRIMRPEPYQAAALESAATLGMIVRRAETTDLIQRTDEFNFYFRICRRGNTEDSLGDVSLAQEAFLDKDVFNYAIGQIPPQARARSRYYYLLILRHLPQAARIIHGSTGRSIAADLAIQGSPLLRMVDDYQRRIFRRILPKQFGHEAFTSIPHAEAIRRGSREFVEDLFRESDGYAEWFNPPAVQAMLDDHLAGRVDAHMIIDAMVTFLLWQQQFCELDGPLPWRSSDTNQTDATNLYG